MLFLSIRLTASPNRKLLYGLFLSGDGNFKLQRRAKPTAQKVPAITASNSLFGDAGFWSPQHTYVYYTTRNTSDDVDTEETKVSLFSSSLCLRLH